MIARECRVPVQLEARRRKERRRLRRKLFAAVRRRRKFRRLVRFDRANYLPMFPLRRERSIPARPKQLAPAADPERDLYIWRAIRRAISPARNRPAAVRRECAAGTDATLPTADRSDLDRARAVKRTSTKADHDRRRGADRRDLRDPSGRAARQVRRDHWNHRDRHIRRDDRNRPGLPADSKHLDRRPGRVNPGDLDSLRENRDARRGPG